MPTTTAVKPLLEFARIPTPLSIYAVFVEEPAAAPTLVANESARALIDLSINYSIPIGNGILTVSNKDQAIIRSDPKQLNKGADAALAC